MSFDWLTQFFGSKAELALAGMAGAAVSSAAEWNGFLSAIRRIIIGTLCAMWLSPLGIPLLKLILGGLDVPKDNAAGVSGFLMGVLGIVFIEFILRIFRVKLGKQAKKDD